MGTIDEYKEDYIQSLPEYNEKIFNRVIGE